MSSNREIVVEHMAVHEKAPPFRGTFYSIRCGNFSLKFPIFRPAAFSRRAPFGRRRKNLLKNRLFQGQPHKLYLFHYGTHGSGCLDSRFRGKGRSGKQGNPNKPKQEFSYKTGIRLLKNFIFFILASYLFPLLAGTTYYWDIGGKKEEEKEQWHPSIFVALRGFDDIREGVGGPEGTGFKIYLESGTNEIDISGFVQILKRAEKSKYNNFHLIDTRVKNRLFESYIIPFCERRAEDRYKCEGIAQKKIQEEINSWGERLSREIRYPHFYHAMADTAALAEVKKNLKSPCPDCGQIRLDKGAQKEFDALFPLIKNQKTSCLKKIIKNTAKRLTYHRPPSSCKGNTTHPVCKDMSENYRLFLDRLSRLTEQAYGRPARSQTSTLLCFDCPRSPHSSAIGDLTSGELEDIWQKAENCKEIPKGEQKQVFSGTALEREYTLRREKDGGYSAVLNLQFVAAEDYEGDAEKDEVPSHYRDRVEKCLNEEANLKMLGPNNEKLRIILEKEPSGGSPCPPPVQKIKIGPPGKLSTENKYASDIDCPVITHEILHQLGLCDEYSYGARGHIIGEDGKQAKVENIYNTKLIPGQTAVLLYDCRVTQHDSIMGQHYQRWGDVFERKDTRSLLTPRQFQAVLYGDCPKKNQLFNECSKLVYKNSFEDKTCLEKRRKCVDQDALGDGK